MIISRSITLRRIVSGTWKNGIYAVITCFTAYLTNELWLSRYFVFPAFVPTILGTALAFFIGFNNNQAYSRWWEARIIWGSIINNSRTWARQVLNYAHPGNNISSAEMETLKAKLIRRHIAFLYVLKSSLRNIADQYHHQYLSPEEIAEISSQTNRQNAILTLQSKDLELLYQNDSIDGFKFVEFNKMIVGFCDDMGKCERIKNTVYPTTYNYYAKAFIWLFAYSVTMTIGNSIGIWAVIFGASLGYVFFTIETIGEVLLNPFELLPTCVPLDQITRTIEINLLEMLGAENVPEPFKTINGEYIT